MKHLPALLLGLGAFTGVACKAHQHGLEANEEVLTIDLNCGLG